MHIEDTIHILDLPEQCIKDCSAGGRVDESVAFWLGELNFTVNRHKATDYLVGTGGWTRDELSELADFEIAEKILWLACIEFNDWIERGEDGEGNNIFIMEG